MDAHLVLVATCVCGGLRALDLGLHRRLQLVKIEWQGSLDAVAK